MKKNKQIIKVVFVLLVSILYWWVLFFLVRKGATYSSDDGVFVLEANDILHGNIFLSGWNLTGISFWASDLLLYIVGVLFAGVSVKAVYIQMCLTFFLLTIIGIALIFKSEDAINWNGIIVFIAMCAFPSSFLLNHARYHSACIIEGLLGLTILIYMKNSKIKSAVTLILFALAAMSDSLIILVILLPIFIVSLFSFISGYVKERRVEREHLLRAVISIVAIIMSAFFDKLFYIIGGANKNSFLEEKSFISIQDLQGQMQLYLSVLMKLFNASFWGTPLFSVSTMGYFVRSCVLIAAVICVVLAIRNYIVDKDRADYVSAVISLGLVITSIVLICTNIAPDEGMGRYIGTFPALLLIVMIRTMKSKKAKNVIYGLTCLVSFIVGIYLVTDVFLNIPKAANLDDVQEIVDVLEENNLSSGYGYFWDAASVSVASKDKIKVRAVQMGNGMFSLYNWFCKTDWYEDDANFVIVGDDDAYGVKYENAISVLGVPSNEVDIDGGKKVLVYDYNISDRIGFLGLNGSFCLSDFYANENVTIENTYRELKSGGILSTPYFAFKEGKHRILIDGDGMENCRIAVYSLSEGQLVDNASLDSTGIYEIELDKNIRNVNVAIINYGNDIVTVRDIQIE